MEKKSMVNFVIWVSLPMMEQEIQYFTFISVKFLYLYCRDVRANSCPSLVVDSH